MVLLLFHSANSFTSSGGKSHQSSPLPVWNDLHTKDRADSHRPQTCSGTRRPTTLFVLFGVKAPTRWLHDDPAGEHLSTLQLVHCILSSLLLNIYAMETKCHVSLLMEGDFRWPGCPRMEEPEPLTLEPQLPLTHFLKDKVNSLKTEVSDNSSCAVHMIRD